MPCFAEWTKTIDCPAGREYRDVRVYAGRNEFCELHLPGSLWVRDGPSRFWFSEGHFGEAGAYRKGRKVGRWRECNRFDHCHETTYSLTWPQETAAGVKAEIPLRYAGGKYVFDFHSCWSTWMTRQTAESYTELNIGHGLIRCQITYLPSSDKDGPAGNAGHYLCEIPYSVGVRAFDSLDLRSEFPKAGLPQFCRADEPSGPVNMPWGVPEMAFALWVNTRFQDAVTGKEAQAWTPLANTVDVVCVALVRRPGRPDRLTVRLNEYAEKLVLDRIGKEETKADACDARFPLTPMARTRDASGHTLFSFGFSGKPKTAALQRACINGQIRLLPACAP